PSLHEGRLDTAVRRGLARLAPAGGGPPRPSPLFPPALDRMLLLRFAPPFEDRLHRRQELRRRGVRLRLRPAGKGATSRVREQVVQLRARLLRADDDDARRAKPADVPVE